MADVVEYFELPEMPGRRMFCCGKRRASLLVERCAAMWLSGHEKISHERFWLCRGCSIGARHAGVAEATLSPLYAMSICARCHSGATRLIGGHVCVSCKNREYEYLKGRNARGSAPVNHPPLYSLSIRYWTGGRAKVLTKPNAASALELVVAALRDEPKQVTFGPLVRPSPLPQMELFA